MGTIEEFFNSNTGFFIAFFIVLGFVLIRSFYIQICDKAWKKYKNIDKQLLKTKGKKYVGKLADYKIIKGTEIHKLQSFDVWIEYADEFGKTYKARAAHHVSEISNLELDWLKGLNEIEITAYKDVCYFKVEDDHPNLNLTDCYKTNFLVGIWTIIIPPLPPKHKKDDLAFKE